MMEDANEGAGEELDDTDGQKTEDCDKECQERKEEERKRKEEEAKRTHDNIENYENQAYEDVERDLDQKLRDDGGWTKKPLRDGNGSRYNSPDGKRQVQINRGYPGGNHRGPSDTVHSGPYIKRPSTGTRIPLARPSQPFVGM